ncbi:MAG: glycosyltransferase family 2 protein, partial [Ferruginibacter sp.]
MQLSVIIVNYNVKYFLEHCLLSVIKACSEIDAEIFVVDNDSSDGSEEYLAPKFPSVRFYWNKTNLGFGKANNSVLKDAKGDYILFLNPDTIVPEDCFTKCISFFQSHQDCGALGVRMIDGSGDFLKESKRCLPTPLAGLFKMIGLTNIFPGSSFFANYYAGHLLEHENSKVEVLAGAFMMLSRKILEITKGFDEAFFMYGEDIDLSYRITKAGLSNYYLGETTMIHFKGESTQKRNRAYTKHFYGAMKLFVNKHYSNKALLKTCMTYLITCATFFAKIKNATFANEKKATPQKPLNILFHGSEQQLEKINSLIKSNMFNISQKIIFNDTTSLEKLNSKILPDDVINAQLFCEGLLNNVFIIKQLTLLPKN